MHEWNQINFVLESPEKDGRHSTQQYAVTYQCVSTADPSLAWERFRGNNHAALDPEQAKRRQTKAKWRSI